MRGVKNRKENDEPISIVMTGDKEMSPEDIEELNSIVQNFKTISAHKNEIEVIRSRIEQNKKCVEELEKEKNELILTRDYYFEGLKNLEADKEEIINDINGYAKKFKELEKEINSLRADRDLGNL